MKPIELSIGRISLDPRVHANRGAVASGVRAALARELPRRAASLDGSAPIHVGRVEVTVPAGTPGGAVAELIAARILGCIEEDR